MAVHPTCILLHGEDKEVDGADEKGQEGRITITGETRGGKSWEDEEKDCWVVIGCERQKNIYIYTASKEKLRMQD